MVQYRFIRCCRFCILFVQFVCDDLLDPLNIFLSIFSLYFGTSTIDWTCHLDGGLDVASRRWIERFDSYSWDLKILQVWSHKFVSPIDYVVTQSLKSQTKMGPYSLHSVRWLRLLCFFLPEPCWEILMSCSKLHASQVLQTNWLSGRKWQVLVGGICSREEKGMFTLICISFFI